MKAEIKKGMLLLTPENKKEVKQLQELVKNNCDCCVIPASRKQLAYYHFQDLKIAIL